MARWDDAKREQKKMKRKTRRAAESTAVGTAAASPARSHAAPDAALDLALFHLGEDRVGEILVHPIWSNYSGVFQLHSLKCLYPTIDNGKPRAGVALDYVRDRLTHIRDVARHLGRAGGPAGS